MQRALGLGVVLLMGCAAGASPHEDESGGPSSGGLAHAGTSGASSGGSSTAGGAASAFGGAATGGSTTTLGGAGTSAGGSSSGASGSGNAGTSSSGGSSVFVPPDCDEPPPDLPDTAPSLTVGEWKSVAPIASFYGNGISLDACNPAILYTAGGNYPASGGPGDDTGVYRSTDAGSTWTKLKDLDSPARVRVDPNDSNHLYVVDGVNGGTQGFWRSTDGGATWEVPPAFLTAASELVCCDMYNAEPDPADFNHVLLTYHYGDGILESTDGGDSFIVHQPDPSWANSGGYDAFFLYDPVHGVGNSQTWLYGTQGKGYFRTTNSGDSWTQVTDVSMEHGGGELYYSEQNSAWYLSGAGAILKSTNNGESWTSLGPYNGYLSVMGDGTRLYSGGHGGGKFVTALEESDSVWSDFNDQTFKEGPYQMRFDAVHGILYSANASGGLWALKVE